MPTLQPEVVAMPYPVALQRIREKLDYQTAIDTEFSSFGAYMHQYRLGRTLSEDELIEYESFFGVQLPDDYRAFLMHIGNGGAGPGYGLERFGTPDRLPPVKPAPMTVSITYTNDGVKLPIDQFSQSFNTMYFSGIETAANDPALLQKPFPYAKTTRFEYPEDEAAIEAWEKEVWGGLAQGVFLIANYGCGMMAYLIVTGEKRGTVWVVDECDGEWVASFNDIAADVHGAPADDHDYTFLDWYEHWLDHARDSDSE